MPVILLKERTEEGILILTLNRPEAMNCFNYDLLSVLSETIREANFDMALRCIVITGAGGADPKKTNAAGRTPLHTAMAVLSVLKVEALIAGGAPVNAQDRNGDTALHLAAAYGKWDLAAVLLRAKADPNIRNREGSTPLHLASAGRKPEKGIPLLLQHGADPRIMNARGLTPPALARAKGVKDAVAAWEKAGVAP